MTSAVRRRIAVLFHEYDRRRDLRAYLIWYFAQLWRDAGHDVAFVFGRDDYVPADIALVHVDLSVVPEEYVELARRYPIALNARVRDIRKSTLSRHVVTATDAYAGPVVVKSDLNHAGLPERRLARLHARARSPLHRVLNRCREIGCVPFRSAEDYRIYDRLDAVPRAYFRDPRVVVERFLPEREDGLYHVRFYHFLGDRHSCARMASVHPIVGAHTSCKLEPIEPHEEIVALRHQLGFDYGKFDYVVHEGRAVLLDANKTTAQASLPMTPERVARWRHRAGGIFSYFDAGSAGRDAG